MRMCGTWRAMAVFLALAVAGCVGSDRRTPGFSADDEGTAGAPASAWEAMVAAALQSEGAELVGTVPSDIGAYCPAYAQAGPEQRRSFWSGVLARLWQADAGGTPPVAGCAAAGGEAGVLACAVRQAGARVSADGALFGGGARGWLGLARDWLPFRRAGVRAEISSWGERQSFCR